MERLTGMIDSDRSKGVVLTVVVEVIYWTASCRRRGGGSARDFVHWGSDRLVVTPLRAEVIGYQRRGMIIAEGVLFRTPEGASIPLPEMSWESRKNLAETLRDQVAHATGRSCQLDEDIIDQG